MNSLQQLATFTTITVPLNLLILDLILTAIFSLLLSEFYLRFGQSLSNRRFLARNFVSIAVTTALVITIVKSSLALSLGLVGALSIVRFRTAIKEPEELAYLFLSIALGLGFGAGQRLVTIVAFLIILIILFIQNLINKQASKSHNLYLKINLKKTSKLKNLDSLLKLISKYTKLLDLKRIDQNKKNLDVAVQAEFNSALELKNLLAEIDKKFPEAQVSVIDPLV